MTQYEFYKNKKAEVIKTGEQGHVVGFDGQYLFIDLYAGGTEKHTPEEVKVELMHGRGINYWTAKQYFDHATEQLEAAIKRADAAAGSKEAYAVREYWSGTQYAWRQVMEALCDGKEIETGEVPGTDGERYQKCTKCGFTEV